MISALIPTEDDAIDAMKRIYGKKSSSIWFDDIHHYDKPIPSHIIFNDPYTIVNWDDGDKTIVKCMEGDKFDKITGFYACLAKKVYGGHNPYKKYIENAQVQG